MEGNGTLRKVVLVANGTCRRKARGVALALVLALSSIAKPSAADDVADEADLLFTLGAEAYQRGDFRSALERFLASNRLVPNRNVLYNIARVYDALKRYPEAYRYYTQALEDETDPGARSTIETALAALAQRVAVVRVETTPPGATLYIDRKDLGPRGDSPRTFGLGAGTYRILAELPGYEPATVLVEGVGVGAERHVKLELKPILGTLAATGPAGASLRLGDARAAVRCVLPCTLELPPGPYTTVATAPGFRPAEAKVTVLPSRRASVSLRLEPLTGTVVLRTDEPRALILVDGKPSGFTPAILTVPVGHHRVELALSGYRPIEREIDVAPSAEVHVDAVLTQAEEVVAASRVGESVEDAPSSVSVIPTAELTSFAYPTLAEAVRGTPGVYVWDDRSYVTVGLRGLGRLGSYGNRIVVLYDGHPVNDDWIGSSYVGYDALTDLGDVERIEVVRGPGSVLYGTNAFSGVLNVVSDRHRPEGASVGIGTNQNGVARARARGDVRLGPDAGAWTSVAAARSRGEDFDFPELAARAAGADGFQAGTVRGGAFYRFLSADWSLHSHSKHLPSGAYETLVGDARTRQTDTRGFLELRAEPKLTDKVQSFTRLSTDLYRFRGAYARDAADGGVELDRFRGAWFGLEQRVIVRPIPELRLTGGGEAQLHVDVVQRAEDESGVYLDESHPFQVAAGYVNADIDFSEAVRASAGARLDAYSTFGTSVSPRGALILRPYEGGNLKILGGKAFRAPSVYELYYNDGGFTQIQSPDLVPEVVYSGEIEHTHRFSPTISGSLTVYGNIVERLIVTQGAGDETDPLRYVNSAAPLAALGSELSLRREWRKGFMLSASYAFSPARFLATSSAGDVFTLRKNPAFRQVANAPMHLGSLKAVAPILSQKLRVATRLTVEGARHDRYEVVGDDPQGETSPFVLWDIVLTGTERRLGLSYALGVYNAFDWRYSLPVSAEFTQRVIRQDGRTFLASAEIGF